MENHITVVELVIASDVQRSGPPGVSSCRGGAVFLGRSCRAGGRFLTNRWLSVALKIDDVLRVQPAPVLCSSFIEST